MCDLDAAHALESIRHYLPSQVQSRWLEIAESTSFGDHVANFEGLTDYLEWQNTASCGFVRSPQESSLSLANCSKPWKLMAQCIHGLVRKPFLLMVRPPPKLSLAATDYMTVRSF